MKKRFTLMMMVLCILMSIPLKMMAKTVTISYIDDESWGQIWAYVYSDAGKIGPDWGGTQCKTITTNADGQRVATWTFNLDDNLAKAYVVFNNGKGNGKQYPAEGVKWIIEDGASYNKNGKITSSGGDSGTTGGGSTDPTEKWDTETVNRLKGRVYSQGFYLAGNFFSFQPKENVDHGDLITYDDAVFKFQQQTDQDILIAKGARTVYEVYKVDIPASLTAHAQVMYVDEFGNTKNIFGPGSAYGVSYTNPKTDESIGWYDATVNDCHPITKENTNYWNFKTRNESASEYSDGMYNLYIAVDAKTHTVKKWKITHISDKRVAYIISDAPDAIAIPLYDTYKPETRKQDPQFFNNFYGTVNFAANRSYYVISNYIYNNTKVDDAKDYGTIHGFYLNRIPSPTTNKLFLQGNGGLDYKGTYPDNLIFPNGAPLKVDKNNWGTQIVEYNPSRGNSNKSVFGFCGDLMLKNQRVVLNSVSLVGDAIPGTTNADGSWNYKSNIADMVYDDTEQCYKATVVTTVADDGKSKFRFVGNREPQITWYENTNDVVEEMAKHPHDSDDPQVFGHTADANDPNQVN